MADIGSSAWVTVVFAVGTEAGDLPDVQDMGDLLMGQLRDYLDDDLNLSILGAKVVSEDWEVE